MEKRAKEFLELSGRLYTTNKEKWKKMVDGFDEDVYNDTILKVYDSILKGADTQGDLNGYWFKSFKNNLNRNKDYSHKKKRDDTDVIELLKDKEYELVLDDIKAVRNVCEPGKITLKVIIETCLLTDDEKIKACELSLEAKADFVKTSTGFSTGGATTEDVALMGKVVGDNAYVKASGGIRDKETALKMVNAGADRLGTSATVNIVS